MTDTTLPLLQVQNLSISLPTRRGLVRAVHGLDLTLARGETVGLIGESGSGKSLTALALLGLLPEGAQVAGSFRLNGQELLGLPERDWCRLRGNRLAMIFQEPMTALNPVHSIGRQVAEPLRLHRRLPARAARAEAIALLERVGIARAAERFDAYPHQFSGGQRQRITIAMALACAPDLLIADEPTTALDVTLQKQVLELIQELVAERGMALLLISHDLAVIAGAVQRTLVMYGGTVVEQGRRTPSSALWPTPTPRACLPHARNWAPDACRACACRPLPARCPNWPTCRPAARLPGAARAPSLPATRRCRRQWWWATGTRRAASA